MFLYQHASKNLFIPNETTYLIPNNHLSYTVQRGLFESSLIDWCRQFCKKDELMIDIGAHTGTYGLTLAPLVREVHAFEPQRITYYGLCGGVALSGYKNVYCHPLGLGSVEQIGPQVLNILNEDGGGSTLLKTTEVIEKENIMIQTLDFFQFQNVCFIKMDVEGNELNVIKGGLQTFQRNNYPRILFEANDTIALEDIKKELSNHTPYQVHSVRGFHNMYLASI